MTEYMKMEQAFECGDNDIPFIEGGYNTTGYSKKQLLSNPNGLRPTILDHFSDQWQVQKAEPKVLTTDEIRTKVTNEDLDNTKSYRLLMYECAEYGIENGRLEMYLEFKKFLNENFKTGDSISNPVSLVNAIENLKPF